MAHSCHGCGCKGRKGRLGGWCRSQGVGVGSASDARSWLRRRLQGGVPSSELRTGTLDLPKAPVHWVADPGSGKAVQFIIVLVPSHFQHLTLSDPGPNNDRLPDYFRLPNGEILALLSRCVPLSESAITMIRAAVGSWTLRNPSGGPVDPETRVRCTMIIEDVDGREAVLDLAIPCLV